MTFAPGTRVFLKDDPTHKGTIVTLPDVVTPTGRRILETNPWVTFIVWDGQREAKAMDSSKLAPIKNTLVTIGCTGNRVAYLNLSVEEATRRFLARENEHVYGDDEKKTQLDSCDRVSVMEFADEFPSYD